MKNGDGRINSDVFHTFRFCENQSWKYLTSLIWDMMHLISLLPFFICYPFFIQKLRTLISTTYKPVVIDCRYCNNVISVN